MKTLIVGALKTLRKHMVIHDKCLQIVLDICYESERFMVDT